MRFIFVNMCNVVVCFIAIVFDKEHKQRLEPHVKYSIRMNQDRVDTTNRLQDR
jgi:hypothetical protein